MSVCYEKLWILLIQKNIKKSELINIAGLTSNVIANMSKGKYVNLEVMEKLCNCLDCKIEDIVEIKKDTSN